VKDYGSFDSEPKLTMVVRSPSITSASGEAYGYIWCSPSLGWDPNPFIPECRFSGWRTCGWRLAASGRRL